MKSIIYAVSIGFFLLISASSGIHAAALVKPADTMNTHILYISHFFNPVEDSSTITGSGEFSIKVIESNTNFDIYQYSRHEKDGKFDLETTSVISSYTKKIDDRTELRVSIPFYYHGGGFLDYYIESFHKAFPGGGLKNGGREFEGDDEIHIQYQPGTGGPYINKSFYGLGDPSFFVKRKILGDNPGLALSLGIKPRLGKKAFINSKTTDMGISLNTDYSYGILYVYAMAGYSYFYGDGIYRNELEQDKNYLLNGGFGAGITLFKSVFFSIQFYGHSSIYETGVKRIDCYTLINSYSLRWQMNKDLVFQFSFDEDPITYAASDISFSLQCEYSF